MSISLSGVTGPAVAELAPNNPYSNWSETNRSNMFTPIDPNQSDYPGPIQKAINYGWDRYLNASPISSGSSASCWPDVDRPPLLQVSGAKNRPPVGRHLPTPRQRPHHRGAHDLTRSSGQPSYDPNYLLLAFNYNGAYYESPVMFYPAKIQG